MTADTGAPRGALPGRRGGGPDHHRAGHAIHGRRFLGDEAAGGWFVRAAEVYPWGPDHLDLTGNDRGTTDLQALADWILDGHDQASCLMDVLFAPIVDGPVSIQATTCSPGVPSGLPLRSSSQAHAGVRPLLTDCRRPHAHPAFVGECWESIQAM